MENLNSNNQAQDRCGTDIGGCAEKMDNKASIPSIEVQIEKMQRARNLSLKLMQERKYLEKKLSAARDHIGELQSTVGSLQQDNRTLVSALAKLADKATSVLNARPSGANSPIDSGVGSRIGTESVASAVTQTSPQAAVAKNTNISDLVAVFYSNELAIPQSCEQQMVTKRYSDRAHKALKENHRDPNKLSAIDRQRESYSRRLAAPQKSPVRASIQDASWREASVESDSVAKRVKAAFKRIFLGE